MHKQGAHARIKNVDSILLGTILNNNNNNNSGLLGNASTQCGSSFANELNYFNKRLIKLQDKSLIYR